MNLYTVTLRDKKDKIVANNVHLKVKDMWHLPEEVLMLTLTVASHIMASPAVKNKCDMRLPENDFTATIKKGTPKTVWTFKPV